MELIIYAISCAAFIGVLVVIVKTVLKKLKEVLDLYHRVGVNANSPILPEAHIMKFAPVPLTVHEKTMYLQPLTLDGHKVYTNKMMHFLLKYKQQVGALRWILLSDLIDKKNVDEVVQSWSSAMNNAQLLQDMQELVYTTFLRDRKRINPSRITLKEMQKNWSWFELLQVWQMMWLVQVKSVEDFIHYLSNQVTGQGTQNLGWDLQKSLTPQSQKLAAGPLMPRYS